jgi:heme exporter protein C
MAAQAAGILAMVGVINLPIIHFSVEWWNTLHQGATITKFARPSIDPDMLWPLLVCLVGFASFFATLTLMGLRNQIVLRESHRPWVRALVEDK